MVLNQSFKFSNVPMYRIEKAVLHRIIQLRMEKSQHPFECDLKVCKVCKKQYEKSNNSPTACVYHKGKWMGAENSKHMGTRSGGDNVGLSLFWDCCESEDIKGEGCARGFHKSYSDD